MPFPSSQLDPKAHNSEPTHLGAPYTDDGGPTVNDWRADIDAVKGIMKDTTIVGSVPAEPTHLDNKGKNSGIGEDADDAAKAKADAAGVVTEDSDGDDDDDFDDEYEDLDEDEKPEGETGKPVTEAADADAKDLKKIFGENAEEDEKEVTESDEDDKDGLEVTETTEQEPTHLGNEAGPATEDVLDFDKEVKKIVDDVMDGDDGKDLDEDQTDTAGKATIDADGVTESEEEDDKEVTESRQIRKTLKVLFESANLTEDVQQKATLLFESAVKAKTRKVSTRLNEAYKARATKQLTLAESRISNLYAQHLDRYATAMVEEWVAKHRPALVSAQKVALAESLIAGMGRLMEEHNLQVPEGKPVDMKAIERQLAEAEQKVNSFRTQANKAKALAVAATKMRIVESVARRLPVAEQNKFKTVAVELPFKGAKAFRTKCQTLSESFAGKKSVTKRMDADVQAGQHKQAEILKESADRKQIHNDVKAVNDVLDKL